MVYCIEPKSATNPRSDTGATINTASIVQQDKSGGCGTRAP
jgi:hypothetical protein